MLLQYNLATGKQDIKELKSETENLIVMIRNICDNHEVFEEGKNKKIVTTSKALLKDSRAFYADSILKSKK